MADSPPPTDNETPASVAITIQLVVLAVAFVIGRALQRIRFQWMGEAGAALLLGLVVGLVLKAAGVGSSLASAVAFKGGIFFYILLPTIMFDAGYSLDTRMFIKNLGSLCTYAFVGTTISCFVVGLMMWAFGSWGWCFRMPLLANLTFGALISATDPVTVLAVFQRLHAQPDLYMNVFGESVLNDAVGMVLYNVIASFLGGKDVNAGSVFAGIGLFVAIFLGSTAIGLAIGLLAAVIFRSRYFYSGPIVISPSSAQQAGGDDEEDSPQAGEVTDHGGSTFEVGLAVVFAYGSYLVADAARCSGIVAVVVNGMVMNMYVRPNLSAEAAHKIETLFKTLAGLFELFVFCYIGTTMFLQEEEFNIMGYTALSLVALAVSRAANILPCTAAVNLLRPRERHIPPRAQFMLWWSGLRGAMAFALSVEASEKYGVYGKVMKTCTFYLIFITVLFNGGTSAYLLERLKLRAEDVPALLLPARHGHGHDYRDGDGYDDEGGYGEEDLLNQDKDDCAGAHRKQRNGGGGAAVRGSLEGVELGEVCGGAPRRWTVGAANGASGEKDEAEDEEEGEGGDRFSLGDVRSHGQLQDDEAGLRAVSASEAGGPAGLQPGLRSKSANRAAAASSTAATARGSRSFRATLARPSALLDRVRSMNDGRLVDRFDAFDRRVAKLLIHPDARRGAEMSSVSASAASAPQAAATAAAASTSASSSRHTHQAAPTLAVRSTNTTSFVRHKGTATGGGAIPGDFEAPSHEHPLTLTPLPSRQNLVDLAEDAEAGTAGPGGYGSGGGGDVGRAWGPVGFGGLGERVGLGSPGAASGGGGGLSPSGGSSGSTAPAPILAFPIPLKPASAHQQQQQQQHRQEPSEHQQYQQPLQSPGVLPGGRWGDRDGRSRSSGALGE